MKSALFTAALRRPMSLLAVLAMAATVTVAHADPINLVTNGGFESTTGSASGTSHELGSLGGNALNATGWTTGGYNFLYTSVAAATGSGAPGDAGTVTLWGNNGFSLSQNGGNFVALDGVYEGGPLQQTINGLVIGQSYTLTFDFAAAQQNNRDGATTENLQATIDGQTFTTGTDMDPSHGFVGWQTETFTFTADKTSSVLSFIALGTPSGDPPFSLLDGVSITANTAPTPEPSSLALMATGLFGVGGMLRSRLKK